jgi:hypothetical protein
MPTTAWSSAVRAERLDRPNLRDVGRGSVVSEDLTELARDLLTPEHLAAVVADHEGVVRERCGHRSCIVRVPAIDQANVQLSDFVLDLLGFVALLNQWDRLAGISHVQLLPLKKISFTIPNGARLLKFRKPFTLYGSSSSADVVANAAVSSERTMSHATTVECASPHRAVHHRDHRCTEERFTAQRSSSSGSLYGSDSGPRRQLADVVAGRPHPLVACGANHDHAHIRAGQLVQVAEDLGDQVGAEGVALGVVVERERADPVLRLGLAERRDCLSAERDSARFCEQLLAKARHARARLRPDHQHLVGDQRADLFEPCYHAVGDLRVALDLERINLRLEEHAQRR